VVSSQCYINWNCHCRENETETEEGCRSQGCCNAAKVEAELKPGEEGSSVGVRRILVPPYRLNSPYRAESGLEGLLASAAELEERHAPASPL
jgi:hypothetical protein